MRREAIVVALLLAVHGRDVARRLRGPSAPRPLAAPPTPSRPVLRAAGLACVPSGAVERCAPSLPLVAERSLLVTGRIDLASAQAPALIAIPGIGPKLAARILEARDRARAQGGRVDRGALAAIRGLGARRAAAIAAALGLDEGVGSDICSTGSWPMISSGCDRPR